MAIAHGKAAFRTALFGWLSVPFARREWMRQSPSAHDARVLRAYEAVPLATLALRADGRIASVNASARRLLGYARHELIGCPAQRLIPGLCVNDRYVTRTFAHRKDGSRLLADVVLDAMKGGSALTLVIVIDRAERGEPRRDHDALAHLTRVSMLGELAASLAHELNQPLTAILSNAQAAQRFLGREPIELDEVREILRDLVADNNRASEILRRIRALVRKGELELAPLSLASVIGDVGVLVHGDALARGIRLAFDIEPHLPLVRGDAVQLQQVVLNLLLNAFDAMDACSARHAAQRVVVVTAAREGEGAVRVEVRDEGRGLPAELAGRLFEPFHTSKRDGLGLGLSISRSIVEMHGGRIWALDNAQCGATFAFSLPVEAGMPARS